MNPATANNSENLSLPPGDERLRVGTLQYTKAGLIWMSVWLLQGYFAFTLMETVSPSIVPLRLKALGISDFFLALVMVTLPNAINTLLNPILSTASDRHRGRWGRRRPFLLFSAPFICGALVLLAFSPEIGTRLYRVIGPRTGWSAAAVGIVTLAALWIVFTIINMFTTTVFYYFFNDVVPAAFMARFFGLFSLVGSLGAATWNWFFYQHALTHMRWIFLGAAAVYLVSFGMMCFKIKEGRYPPPAPLGLGFWAKLWTYAQECCSHRLFVLMFAYNICWAASGACAIYLVFLYLSLGLGLDDQGRIAAVVNVVGMLLSIPAGMLSDRFHPMRVMVWIKFGLVALTPLNFIWLFGPFRPHPTAFGILIGLNAVTLPLGVLSDVTRQPMQMRVWPQSHYGQFCSFNAIVQAFFSLFASLAAGTFMFWMRHLLPDAVYGKDFCYRLIPIWQLPFLISALILLMLMYQEWKRLGGLTDYKVPGFEEGRA